MKLKKELLAGYHDEQVDAQVSTEKFYNCWNAKGLYNSMQFVLRLRPDIHALVDNLPDGHSTVGDIGYDGIQAYSTYLHETVHWWQHCGSTVGLLTSLSFPAQSHNNFEFFKRYLELTGAKKPIVNYNAKHATEYNPTTDEFKVINQILNDYFDIEFYRWYTFDPKSVHHVVENPIFESVGHSFYITYAMVIALLAATFDEKHEFLPDTDKWKDEFLRLASEREEGYYHGSAIRLPPVGVRDIFEGQARFIQLQLLHFTYGESLKWEDFVEQGMLSGVYVTAFNFLLEITETKQPENIGDPIVALFLLICDVSINPGDGFPFDVGHFESFLPFNDPGVRFYLLCCAVRDRPELKCAIKEYSYAEYADICKILCDEIVVHTPLDCSKKVVDWSKECTGLREIMKEDDTFGFSDVNLPVRLLIARFIRFNEDKLKYPEFFCWPGVWSVGDRANAETKRLFQDHQALFMDKADGDIYPRVIPGKPGENVTSTFERFYAWNVVYDLARQWVMGEGNFSYDYFWLTSKFDYEEMSQFAIRHFVKAFGANPEMFEVIP